MCRAYAPSILDSRVQRRDKQETAEDDWHAHYGQKAGWIDEDDGNCAERSSSGGLHGRNLSSIVAGR